MSALEELLASKLAEFLDGVFSYCLSQLSSVAKTHLYKGPPDVTATTPTKTDSDSSSLSFVSSDSKPHPLKGGWIIQEYLTYDWYCTVCVMCITKYLRHKIFMYVNP